MTFGQEFHTFATFLKMDVAALEALVPQLAVLNLGATAIGTGICADLRFREAAIGPSGPHHRPAGDRRPPTRWPP